MKESDGDGPVGFECILEDCECVYHLLDINFIHS